MHYMEAAMRTVTAREANQSFSKLLREVAAGEEVVITLRGKPVARLSRIAEEKAAERERLAKEMVEMLRKGWHLGDIRVDRDEIYDR
jgi:prevent-host-death family protein